MLESLGHREAVVLPKDLTDDPTEAGYRSSKLGKRKGQKRDYRMRASALDSDDGRELHLREYENRYTLHWDAYPAKNPMHAVKDAPGYGVACATAVGVVAVAVGSGLAKRRSVDNEREPQPAEDVMENVVVGGKRDGGEEASTRSSRLPSVPSVSVGSVAGVLSKPVGFVGSLSEKLPVVGLRGRKGGR